MASLKMASWWTPAGWMRDREAAAYRAAMNDDSNLNRDWPGDLQAVGYYGSFPCGLDDGFQAYTTRVWQHAGNASNEPHLLIEVWDNDSGVAVAFVAEEFIPPFWIDKLPQMVRDQKDVNAPDMSKAWLAFIRHGHDTTPIDQYGSESVEERRQRLAHETRERDRRAADKKAVAP